PPAGSCRAHGADGPVLARQLAPDRPPGRDPDRCVRPGITPLAAPYGVYPQRGARLTLPGAAPCSLKTLTSGPSFRRSPGPSGATAEGAFRWRPAGRPGVDYGYRPLIRVTTMLSSSRGTGCGFRVVRMAKR